ERAAGLRGDPLHGPPQGKRNTGTVPRDPRDGDEDVTQLLQHLASGPDRREARSELVRRAPRRPIWRLLTAHDGHEGMTLVAVRAHCVDRIDASFRGPCQPKGSPIVLGSLSQEAPMTLFPGFTMPDELRRLGEQIRRFIREEIIPLEQRLDPDAPGIPDEDFERLSSKTKAAGLWALGAPEEYGGGGLDTFSMGGGPAEKAQQRTGL